MSGGLAPSKSTVYVSNLPFSLTNNDLHKIFVKYGDLGKVTIVKDKVTHKSKGMAFILFLKRDDAWKAVRALNATQMFGRTLKCSIAKDNGRAPEFIRRKTYPDKSSCYECGEVGHLSYECPKNLLGDRARPEKKKKKNHEENFSDEDEEEVKEVTEVRKRKSCVEEAVIQGEISEVPSMPDSEEPKRKHYKKDSYFSDEESLSE